MASNQSVSLSPTQSPPQIRAPLSTDSDFESALKSHKRSSSTSSSSSSSSSSSDSVKSFVSEEVGFLSGEDGFETASEKHPEEETNLELAAMEQQTGLGSLVVPPKARISGEEEEDEDDIDEVEAEESVDDRVLPVIRVPLASGEIEEEGDGGGAEDGNLLPNGLGSVDLEEQKAPIVVAAVSKEEIVPENGVVSESPVLELSPEKAPIVVVASKEEIMPDNGVVSESPVLELVEEKAKAPIVEEVLTASKGDILPENGLVPQSSVPESVEEKAPIAVETTEEGLLNSKDDILSENGVVTDTPVLNLAEDKVPIGIEHVEEDVVSSKEVILPENGPVLDLGSVAVVEDEVPVADKAVEVVLAGSTEDVLPEKSNLENGGLESKPVLDSVSTELVKDSVSGPTEVSNEALVATSEDILPENPKLDVVVIPEIGGKEKEEVETQDEVVSEEKSEVEVGEMNNKVVDEKKSEELISGTDEVSPEDAVLIDSKVVEEENEVKPKSEEDLRAETKSISLGPESEDTAEVEEKSASEAKLLEVVEVDSSASVGVVSDQAPAVIGEADELEVVDSGVNLTKVNDGNGELGVSAKSIESVKDFTIETQEKETEKPKIEVMENQKDDDENNRSTVANSLSLDSDNNGEKPELGSEAQTHLGVKLNEPVEVVDGDENVSGDKLDVIGQAQSADSCAKPEEVSISNEDKMEVLSTKGTDAVVSSQDIVLEEVDSNSSHTPETALPKSIFDTEVKGEVEAEEDHFSDYEEGEGSVSDDDNNELNFGSSGTAEQIMKELMRGSGVSFNSGPESSQNNSQRIDGQIVMDSDEEVDTDEEGDGKELFDSAALAALLKAATSGGSEGGNMTITSQDGSRLFSMERPAGLGSSIRPLKPAPQQIRPNIFTPSDLMVGGESEVILSEEEKKKLEKIQLVRVKFLRLLHKLGHSPDDTIAAQVLYRMVLAAGRQTGQAFSLEAAKKKVMQLEAENSDDLDFSLNILVLGKTGVGKSATINSIFGEEKAKIGAFEPATTMVKEIVGTVDGVKIRVFDTPGLRSSVMEQNFNRNVLSSVKKLTKKHPLDILLYVDRLDTQTRDLNDLPLLRTITNTLGSSIWRSAVVTLTHAASAPPDGPSGSPLSYEVFVAQRSHIVQQSIGQAVGDLRMMNPSLMNPVSLVENHPSCRKNREGQRILPNGQVWRPQLLLLCYSLKVLSELTSLSKPQDVIDHRKLFGFRVRAPPLPYLLSSLLQSRAHPKLPDDQGGDNVDSDIDLEDLSDSDQDEEEDEYDQLPPFKPLQKTQIAKLSKDQRKAYFDEYDYRVKLLQKKQWRDELKRMKEMKKKGKDQTDNVDYPGEDADQEGPAAVQVPLPDMVLPPSFDGDNPAYRYRFLEPTSQLLARPVLDTHGWDHDCGYDGVSLEENLAIAGRFPGGVVVQITKDKKEFNVHLDSSIAAKHGENGSTLAGFDIQTIGKQLGYIVRGETKFKNFKKNKTTGGVSVIFLGENVVTGLKVEDQISIGKRLTLVGSTGTIRSQGDAAYGANLEVRLKEKDFPIGQDQSTLGLSLMRWRGDLALGANLQSQVSIGRSSKMSIRVGLNNKLSGQITVRTSSSEQLQLALVGILPIAISIYRSIWPSTGESFSAY